MNKKICKSCNLEKDINQFSKSKRLGYQAQCKSCATNYLKQYRELHKDKLALKNIKYRELNKQRIAETKRKWQKDNATRLTNYYTEYEKKRKLYDLEFKLKKNLRSHLATALNGNYKSGSAVRDLGCTIDELRQYLESLFKPGMTWNNWSRTGWHIDHKKPLSSYDLTNPIHLKDACHYTNLQPMWAIDNLIKGSKYE